MKRRILDFHNWDSETISLLTPKAVGGPWDAPDILLRFTVRQKRYAKTKLKHLPSIVPHAHAMHDQETTNLCRSRTLPRLTRRGFDILARWGALRIRPLASEPTRYWMRPAACTDSSERPEISAGAPPSQNHTTLMQEQYTFKGKCLDRCKW